MKVQHDNGKNRTRRFFRKKSGSFKNGENVLKIKDFGLSWKLALRILIIFSVKVVLSSVLQPAKTVRSKKVWFSWFLRSNLNHSVGVVIPWANMSLNMCYILLICQYILIKLEIKVHLNAKITAEVKARAVLITLLRLEGPNIKMFLLDCVKSRFTPK